jgi:hypothetical protein
MSVWPKSFTTVAALNGSEGALVSVSIQVDPAALEALLEALAQLSFPINPQIYHEALVIKVYPDSHEEEEAATLVEFPAYAERLAEVRQGLALNGFDPAALQVTGMLDEIHAGPPVETAPAGAPYVKRYRVKTRAAASVH